MQEKFYIGTYTHHTSKGVYELTLDTTKKEMTNVELAGEAGNPTYVALSDAGKLYAVDKDQEQGKGGVRFFDVTEGSKPFAPVQTLVDQDTNPAYVAVDEARQLLYTANYHTAEVSAYSIHKDGTVELADRVTHSGQVGPKEEQADGPHPHFSNLTPDNRLVVCDLGLDKVFVYDVSAQGKLAKVSEITLGPGFGPRHIVFTSKGDTAYLVGELSSKVAVLKYDQNKGSFELGQVISTIPADWTAHNGSAAIRLSADDKFLYVSNRGNNSLAVFEAKSADKLELVQRISTEGDFPRDFNFSADQSLVVCLNQNTNNASLYERDGKTGKLTLVQKDFEVPEGVCVLPEN
ncbi:lactonase family protein [Lentilactobacillus sp. Marseille-Q4993]|uniref:lactonase family protein n=1 Tax=Lentilactobacillus sp. Marseille-Q4993 TaxID=3039492 RepID=UPI0024BC152B|nr:lactonase family protein [Lentilactobacillus sp. Marseille-Q4993]